MKWKGEYRIIQKDMEREEHDQKIIDHNEEMLLERREDVRNDRGQREGQPDRISEN